LCAQTGGGGKEKKEKRATKGEKTPGVGRGAPEKGKKTTKHKNIINERLNGIPKQNRGNTAKQMVHSVRRKRMDKNHPHTGRGREKRSKLGEVRKTKTQEKGRRKGGKITTTNKAKV